MQGRNGTDQFARFVSWVALALILISLFTGKVLNGVISSIAWMLSLAAIAYSFFRMFSKNVVKRRIENQRYLACEGRVKGWFSNQKQRYKDRKIYKYFRCPGCRATLRVPRGKGKVQITCKKCGKKFLGNT